MINTVMVEIYYKLVKANMADPTKGKAIDQVPENLRAAVQEKIDAYNQTQTE